MQKMFVDRFTLKRFFDDFRDETYIDMFKKCREAYEKDQDEKKYGKYRKIVLENLNFLIGEKDQKKLHVYLDYRAIEFFNLVFNVEMIIKIMESPREWMTLFNECYQNLKALCEKEDEKLYWQKKCISEEYVNEDIIITYPCYIRMDEKKDKIPYDLIADTIYGDWGCTVYNKDTKEKLGRFCADASFVCIAKLKDVLKYNPDFEKWMKEHDWCVTLIKNFTGTAYIKYDIKHFEYEGKPDKDLYCYIEGVGNINFIAGQTEC